jgi:DNA-binding MarR family transcriptional regulator
MTIREDVATVLQHLATYAQYTGAQNEELAKALDMSAERLNTAVSLLENNGYVKPLRVMGTGPFDFARVEITPQGKLELERAEAAAEAKRREAPGQPLIPNVRPSPVPVGSPYGFTSHDLEYISLQQQSPKLSVVFGYKWESKHYDADKLIDALTDEFTKALAASKAAEPLSLEFTPLKAGYGEHLFNQIARSIIAADIGVFETSDLSPNVMIEMGVALTWGVRVHPIREESTAPPPSDISGQTWVCYRDSGSTWADPRHFDSVVAMVDVAARKKLSQLP